MRRGSLWCGWRWRRRSEQRLSPQNHQQMPKSRPRSPINCIPPFSSSFAEGRRLGWDEEEGSGDGERGEGGKEGEGVLLEGGDGRGLGGAAAEEGRPAHPPAAHDEEQPEGRQTHRRRAPAERPQSSSRPIEAERKLKFPSSHLVR